MNTLPVPEPEARTQGCEECLAIGQQWVHLRKCLECGHVGCCDLSIGKHATKHATRPAITSSAPSSPARSGATAMPTATTWSDRRG